MENTPKVNRKSLSLGSRLNSKRHSASPQSSMRTVHVAGAIVINSAEATTPRSPSVISISSDCGIECTPPHKKFGFDDSLDYSPHTLDSSCSPSGIFSQTLAIESPEVGWKWNREKFDKIDEATIVTPDSAYAADSSFTSAGSNSTEVFSNARTRSDTQRQRRKLDNRREQHRKALQQQQRKAEKLKMDEMLKRRCAKLQEQMKEAQINTLLDKEAAAATTSKHANQTIDKTKLISSSPITSICTHSATASQLTTVTVTSKSVLSVNSNDNINDFLNDSEFDGLLMEATQRLESQIVELTQQKPTSQSNIDTTNSQTLKMASETSVVATTPKSSCKKKQRSSFYSKFLEDDSADDWFVALDDVVLQATQKPRTSFQRYKSMPIDTTTSAKESTRTGSTIANKVPKKDASVTPATESVVGLKRHASSHVLSPSSTSSTDSIETHLTFCKETLLKFIETEKKTSNENGQKDFGFRPGTRNDLLNAENFKLMHY